MGGIMDLKQMIGARIKDIRNKQGITQEQLSEKIGINTKYLSSIERGKENPTLNILLNLAQSLDVNLDEIFSDIQIEDPKNRKAMINSLLNQVDDEQLKFAYKILSAIIK
jgi:transcriptional regulator with XRE-family HTH domain